MLYVFEDYALDTDRHELRRGGECLPVEPQVFDLLAYLIANRERVVSQDDLLAGVWEGRIVSESTLRSRINAARTAIGDDGQAQRLIRTVQRKGFRFIAPVREEEAAPVFEVQPTAAPALVPSAGANAVTLASVVRPDRGIIEPVTGAAAEATSTTRVRGIVTVPRGAIVLAASACLVTVVAALFVLLWPGTDAMRGTSTSRPAQRFNATAVPLVDEEERRSLSSYPDRPDAKAVAIALDRFWVTDGALNTERAQQEALRQCGARTKEVCRIYAVGMDVVWSRLPLPDPRDLRTDPLSMPLNIDDIPNLGDHNRRVVAERYVPSANHKALALTTGAMYWAGVRASRAEAIRLAIERCVERRQRPCLLLSVDGFLTIQIPRSRRIIGIFLPSTEPDIPVSDRERIARVYQGTEWRALARGKNNWHAVAEAPSEAGAMEKALSACAVADAECRLYALGNFRVADDR